jgi:hypothetical protein
MFTRQVWDKITQDNNLKTDWIGSSITDCLDHWTTSEKFYKMLPPLVNWYIWLSRNCKIFENKNPSTSAISYKALGLFHLWKDMYRDTEKKKILVKPPSTLQLPTGWFDGASQQNGSLSGAGGLINLSQNSIYRWTLCCGPGTNTRAETSGCMGNPTLGF